MANIWVHTFHNLHNANNKIKTRISISTCINPIITTDNQWTTYHPNIMAHFQILKNYLSSKPPQMLQLTETTRRVITHHQAGIPIQDQGSSIQTGIALAATWTSMETPPSIINTHPIKINISSSSITNSSNSKMQWWLWVGECVNCSIRMCLRLGRIRSLLLDLKSHMEIIRRCSCPLESHLFNKIRLTVAATQYMEHHSNNKEVEAVVNIMGMVEEVHGKI